MINIVVILLMVSLNSVLSHVHSVNESKYFVDRITDCFFTNNDTETVELVCDNIKGDYPTDNCYSLFFEAESREINRSKVKRLKSGQCRSKTFGYSEFDELIDTFPNITDLNLAFMGTHSMSYAGYSIVSKPFQYLKVLNVSNNKIGLENGYYGEISGNFDVIDVSFNLLTLNFGLQFVGNITTLNLSFNSIPYLPTLSLSGVRQLKVLDLRNNKMAHLDENVLENVSSTLEMIHLQNNQMKHIVDNFQILYRKLVHLNLSRNQIEDYNYIWTNYARSKLQHLDLSHNNIEQILIDGVRSGINLKSLNVSYNRLQSFNCTYEGSMALNVLSLEGNDLDQLDTISPSNFPNLTTISISKNRFDCEYAQRFAQQWRGIRVIGDLCDQKGNEDEPTNYSIGYVICGLFGCVIVVAAILLWIFSCKISSKKEQAIIEDEKIQYRSSEQYEEPVPFVEPIYHEIEYSETRPPTSSYANKQYDHLTRDPLPLSPRQLHYDNLKKCNKTPFQKR